MHSYNMSRRLRPRPATNSCGGMYIGATAELALELAMELADLALYIHSFRGIPSGHGTRQCVGKSQFQFRDPKECPERSEKKVLYGGSLRQRSLPSSARRAHIAFKSQLKVPLPRPHSWVRRWLNSASMPPALMGSRSALYVRAEVRADHPRLPTSMLPAPRARA